MIESYANKCPIYLFYRLVQAVAREQYLAEIERV